MTLCGLILVKNCDVSPWRRDDGFSLIILFTAIGAMQVIYDCLDDNNCLPDVQKFISVMSSSNKVIINELARFVHDGFKQRLCPTST